MGNLNLLPSPFQDELLFNLSTRGQDRMGRADAVWYERTEGQFSPRHSDRPVSRLQSASPFGFREPSEPPPEMPCRPLVRRRSTDATNAREPPDRVRRSFPQRIASGTVTWLVKYALSNKNAKHVSYWYLMRYLHMISHDYSHHWLIVGLLIVLQFLKPNDRMICIIITN